MFSLEKLELSSWSYDFDRLFELPYARIWLLKFSRKAKVRGLGLGFCIILAGCGGTYGMDASDRLDLQLQHTQTSPIAGATARIFPAPAGTPANAPPANFCVTDAGYCPLTAQAKTGQNCLCQDGSLNYGGVTGSPPQYNKTSNPQ